MKIRTKTCTKENLEHVSYFLMNIQVDCGENSLINAKIEFKKDQNDIILQCSSKESPENEILIQDNLSQFSTITVDDNNPLRLILHGENVDRTYIFQSSINVSDFFKTLQETMNLNMQAGPGRVFQISKKTHQQNTLTGYLEKGISGGINIVKNFVQQQNQPNQSAGSGSALSKDANDFDTIIQTDGIQSGIVDQELPKDFKTETMVEIPSSDGDAIEKLSHIKFSEQKIMNKEIMELLLLIFTNGMKKEEMYEKYGKLKQQWKNIGKEQWDHSFCLRKYVVEAESSIRNSQCCNPPFDEILFDILMALFSFYFQKLDYDHVSVHFLEVFIKYFISNVSEDNQIFTSATRENLNKDQIEALIFWPFKNFYSKFLYDKSINYMLKGDLLSKVKDILLIVSPSTAALLDEYEVKNLSFLKNHPSTLFTRERSNNDMILIICAISSSSNPFLFFQCLVAGILVVLQCRLQECDSLKEFGQAFDTLSPNIDTRLIIRNAEKIFTHLLNVQKEKESHQNEENEEK